MDYMLVACSKSVDGFSDEPGAVYFLGVPSDEDTPKFRHKMSPRAWRDAVLEQARSGTRNTQTTGDIVFYVHGYNNSQETVLERQRKLQRGLERNGFDGVVVSFDWPSADNVLNYLEDRHDAKKSALMLVKHGIHAFAKCKSPRAKSACMFWRIPWVHMSCERHSMMSTLPQILRKKVGPLAK